MRQATTSARQVQWRLPRHWRAGSASWRTFVSSVSLCVLPHAVLGSAPFVPAGMLLSVGGCCFLMCGMDATGNHIGEVVFDRVAWASRICAVASRDAPLVAARCRLALAMGLVSRLSEHSVLVDCPLDCISICGTYCSTRLAIRFLVAKSTEHSGASRDETSSSVSEEGGPPAIKRVRLSNA